MLLINRQPRLRILFVSFKYYPLYGGAETQARLLARVLTEMGHIVTVLTIHFPGTVSNETVDRVRVIRVPRRLSIGYKSKIGILFALLDAFVVLGGLAREIDVIHLHGASILLIPTLLWGQILRIPRIVKLADGGSLADDINIILRSKLRWLQYPLLRNANAFICLNDALEKQVRKSYGPNAYIRHIPNGIETSAWQRTPGFSKQNAKITLGLENQKVVVFTGRLDIGKGVEFLIQVWANVIRSFPNACLLLVGDGPLRGQLSNLINQMNIQDRVRFVGAVENVKPFLFAADLFVLLSPNEGMSNALLEAMAAGLPIVCTDNAGNRAVVQPDITGLLVSPENIENATCQLVRLLADEALAEQLASRARQDISSRFDIHRVAREYVALYSQLLAGAALLGSNESSPPS